MKRVLWRGKGQFPPSTRWNDVSLRQQVCLDALEPLKVLKRIALTDMSTADLVKSFADIVVAQDEASLGGQIAKFNRLFDKMMDVSNELKRREGDQRILLLALFKHPDVQVRLQAAKLTLALAPDEARAQLEEIVEL